MIKFKIPYIIANADDVSKRITFFEGIMLQLAGLILLQGNSWTGLLSWILIHINAMLRKSPVSLKQIEYIKSE